MCGEGSLIPDDPVRQRNEECLAERENLSPWLQYQAESVSASSSFAATAPLSQHQPLQHCRAQQHIPAVSCVPAPASVRLSGGETSSGTDEPKPFGCFHFSQADRQLTTLPDPACPEAGTVQGQGRGQQKGQAIGTALSCQFGAVTLVSAVEFDPSPSPIPLPVPPVLSASLLCR